MSARFMLNLLRAESPKVQGLWKCRWVTGLLKAEPLWRGREWRFLQGPCAAHGCSQSLSFCVSFSHTYAHACSEVHDLKFRMWCHTVVCVHVCSLPQLCLTLCDPMDLSPSGSSIHGISQLRMLEWDSIFFSRGSSQPREGPHISCIGRWILHCWAAWEAPSRPHCPVWKLLALTSEYYDCFLLRDDGGSSLELKNRTFLFLTICSRIVPQLREGERVCFVSASLTA